MKDLKIKYLAIISVFAVVCAFFPLYGQESGSAGREPININLIIDGSSAYTGVKDEIYSWLSSRLDAILSDGDRVNVWNAGAAARVVYSGVITGESEREAVKKAIRDLNASGDSADFTGALREASARQSGSYSYTLLITASPQSITGSSANQLRYSRVEEFKNWRALVVGLNLDTKVKQAANSFFGS